MVTLDQTIRQYSSCCSLARTFM